jgi:hypothetical protein
VSFSDSESVINLERAMDGNVLAANSVAAPPINMSRLVKFAMRPLLPNASIHAETDSTIEPFQL